MILAHSSSLSPVAPRSPQAPSSYWVRVAPLGRQAMVDVTKEGKNLEAHLCVRRRKNEVPPQGHSCILCCPHEAVRGRWGGRGGRDTVRGSCDTCQESPSTELCPLPREAQLPHSEGNKAIPPLHQNSTLCPCRPLPSLKLGKSRKLKIQLCASYFPSSWVFTEGILVYFVLKLLKSPGLVFIFHKSLDIS